MSSINSAGSGAYNLIGSIAGSQRNHGDSDRLKSDAAGRRFSMDQNKLTENVLSNVSGTESSPDRDANGRLPFDAHTAEHDEIPPHADFDAPSDEDGLRGQTLDLQA